MTKEDFLAQVDRGIQSSGSLPVSSALLKHLAETLKKGDPPWWLKTQKAWEKRSFVAWSEAWGLFLTCVHFEVLSDADNPLVPYFPSCGGTAEADPSSAFAKFLADPPATFFERLKTGHRRSYVEGRAPLWISASVLYFQRKRLLPYYLVEVNAGAGLNLMADVLAADKHFDSGLILARIGLDPEPLQLEDIIQRRWLTAALMPESLPAIAAMDRAADALLKKRGEEAAFVQLAPCAAEAAPKFIAQNIPVEPDAGLMVYNMGTTVRMTDPQYEAFKAAMAATLKPWGDRGLWLEVESVRGEMYSNTFQFRLHRMLDGVLSQQLMGSVDLGGGGQLLIEEAAKFLAVP